MNFDVVIINTRFYIHSLYGGYFAKKQKAKCITIDHGTSHLSVHNKFLDVLGGIYEHGITKVLQLFCKEYYGVSLACNEWLSHFHIKPSGVLYNAIDLDMINAELKHPVRDFREEFQIKKEDTVVAFTGRLLKEKGIYPLLEAVERLNKEGKVYLLLAGDGDEEEMLAKKANQFILPVGRLSFPEVIALLKQSDIFCLPSFSEGFSTSVLEAAACGCYVITTKRGGSKELIKSKEHGMIIDNNHSDLVYEALKQAILHPKSRQKAVELTYKELEENYTWDIVADKVHKL